MKTEEEILTAIDILEDCKVKMTGYDEDASVQMGIASDYLRWTIGENPLHGDPAFFLEMMAGLKLNESGT